MNWLAFSLFCFGIVIVMMDNTKTANPPDPRQSPPQPEEDVDHTVTFRDRSVGMCKMPELEQEQMN